MQSMEEMDEAEKYQRRLRVITERLQQQEEEEKLRRETEEEWLKKAQTKRKYLRDQWLSETSRPPVLLPLDSFRTGPLPQEDEDTPAAAAAAAAEHKNSQKTPEDETEETADAREKEQASREGRKESLSCVATARAHDSSYQAATDEDARVTTQAEEHVQTQMEKQMFLESGQDGRSVLGMVAVQVERDPKTGATVVRSVAPVSTPGGAERAHATRVFDDGRMSIHAVGGPDGQPSNEELGQILNVIDGVGMKALLLDEVTVTPAKTETKTETVEASRKPGDKLSLAGHHAMTAEIMQRDGDRSYVAEAELSTDDSAVTAGTETRKKDDGNVSAVTVDDIDEQKLEDGPVTLLFLGYTDATTDQGSGQDGGEGVITVERVMITDDGEEYVLGDEDEAEAAPAPPAPSKVAEQEAGKESKDGVFQEVPLGGGNGAEVQAQGDKRDTEPQGSTSPDKAEEQGKGTTKRKSCQCCSVM